jgi:hypothetical protein
MSCDENTVFELAMLVRTMVKGVAGVLILWFHSLYIGYSMS